MKKKLLCCAMLGGLGLAHGAIAQEVFDDRWYVTGTVGHVFFDDSRSLTNDWQLGLGFGKFFAPRWSWDVDLNYINPQRDGSDLNWSQHGLGITGRYHFRDEGDNWWPYLAFGAGAWRHETEFSDPTGGPPLQIEGTNLELHTGFGLQADLGRVDMRAELGYRYDLDDESMPNEDAFADWMATVGVAVALGPEPAPPVEPTPAPEPDPAPVVTCADLDDDGDGVNNCDDRCPNSTAGQTVGPDGCPVPVTIDLRGVNFDFDKATLRPDAIATLNEAVSILQQYPDLRVEVAGHTDLCGSDTYNQGLSERRARAVYDHLTSNGIAASRLAGPNGYGESRPLESTPQSYPDCRSETNRRTELNVEN